MAKYALGPIGLSEKKSKCSLSKTRKILDRVYKGSHCFWHMLQKQDLKDWTSKMPKSSLEKLNIPKNSQETKELNKNPEKCSSY